MRIELREALLLRRVVPRKVESLLFGVTFSDPATYAVVMILLAAVAALAGYYASRRASRLDSMEALRAE